MSKFLSNSRNSNRNSSHFSSEVTNSFTSEEGQPQPKKSRRSEASERKAERKANKKHSDLIQALKKHVEESQDISNLIGGSVALELLAKHDASRLIQRALPSLSPSARETLFQELDGHWVALSNGAYSSHFVAKAMKSFPKCSARIAKEFLQSPSSVPLWPMIGSCKVLDVLFAMHMNSEKREALLQKLKHQMDSSKSQDSTPLIQALDKGAGTSVILHAFLLAFPHLLTQLPNELSIPLENLIHTQPGAKLAASLIASGDAKAKKMMIKSLKPVLEEAIRGEYSHLTLIAAIWAVDDTVLLGKHLLSPLASCAFTGPWECKVALFCLVGPCKRFFPSSMCDWLLDSEGERGNASPQSMMAVIPRGKKPWETKQAELRAFLLDKEFQLLERLLNPILIPNDVGCTAARLSIVGECLKDATDDCCKSNHRIHSLLQETLAPQVNALLEAWPETGFFLKGLIRCTLSGGGSENERRPEFAMSIIKHLDWKRWCCDVRGVYLQLSLVNSEVEQVSRAAKEALGPLREQIALEAEKCEAKGVQLLLAAMKA